MMTGKDESILMSIPMLDSIFPQLTNQQFINCAFLERPPSCVSLLSYRTALILLIGDSLSRKTKDLLVGVSTVSYKLL